MQREDAAPKRRFFGYLFSRRKSTSASGGHLVKSQSMTGEAGLLSKRLMVKTRSAEDVKKLNDRKLRYTLAYAGTKMAALPVLSSAMLKTSSDSSGETDSLRAQPGTVSRGSSDLSSPENHPALVNAAVQTDELVNYSSTGMPLYTTLTMHPQAQPSPRMKLLSPQDKNSAPLASSESLCPGDLSVSISTPAAPAPVVCIYSPAEPLNEEHFEQHSVAVSGFLQPGDPLSRKSSSGDSAVDLKFVDDDAEPERKTDNFTSTDENECTSPRDDNVVRQFSAAASWRKLRNVVVWAPFFQSFQRQKYPWIQLAGHQGNFRAGDQGTILKRHCDREAACLQALMNDVLRPYVPEFRGIVERDGEKFVRMQDLLMDFQSPSLMDCKLGVRTYLEEELVKARKNPTARKDMYEKMVEVDPAEPSEQEHEAGAVTKPRYMQWRETISSTSSLGFRIEGVKKSVGTSTRDFKKTRTREELVECFEDFTDCDEALLEKYLQRLRVILAAVESSKFISSHELVGSSLLFVHDESQKASVWMIDFGKSVPLPPHISTTHRAHWLEGSHEDGYILGLENIISIMQTVLDRKREGNSRVTTDSRSASSQNGDFGAV